MLSVWKRHIFVFATSWSLLAFVAWHYESTCGAFFSAECGARYWDGLRWIVLLKWVATYQTLLGGLAAVAAGTFVLLAAKATSAEAQRAENLRRKRAARVACSIITDEFRDAIRPLREYSSFLPKSSPFTQTPTYIPIIHEIDPSLGSIVSAQKRDIEETILSTSYDPKVRNTAIARCHMMYHLLIAVADTLNENGTYSFRERGRIPAGSLDRQLRDIQINPKSIVGLYALFDWEKRA